MELYLVRKGSFVAPQPRSAQLRVDLWNDYSFVTMFQVTLFDEETSPTELGSIKIGFKNQTTAVDTYETLEPVQDGLPEGYFSIGTDVDYYRTLYNDVSSGLREDYLKAVRDLASMPELLAEVEEENVFETSLLRGVSRSAIGGQFSRVLAGGAPLTDYRFRYIREATEAIGSLSLSFDVQAESLPSTNIHALIGRNGIGKTTILNGMVDALLKGGEGTGCFERPYMRTRWRGVDEEDFGRLVSISFSAFDPFVPPEDDLKGEKGLPFAYVGLKDPSDPDGRLLKRMDALEDEFVSSLGLCRADTAKEHRWKAMVKTLESDENFARLSLSDLLRLKETELDNRLQSLFSEMSSGHKIVLLILTRLVETVEEKTLILFDEPESHLHPPLLSAFTRALAELLYNRNGVAIMATHSPVVLQEVPKSCVWKIERVGKETAAHRPLIETFGENVGVLTREVFGLEVQRSGFHALLTKSVEGQSSYEDILDAFNEKIGFEGRAVLQALISERDSDDSDRNPEEETG